MSAYCMDYSAGNQVSHELVLEYLTAVFGNDQGYVHVAYGQRQYVKTGGKYGFGDFTQSVHQWPQEAEQLAARLADDAERFDVYVCPNLLSGTKREAGTALSFDLLHADVDHEVEPEKLQSLKAFAVASGRDGHAHVYVRLSQVVSHLDYKVLQRGMRDFFDGDDKVSDNDLLRPVGTLNHKPTYLDEGASPLPVRWLLEPGGQTIDPLGAATVLGVELPAGGADKRASGQRVPESVDGTDVSGVVKRQVDLTQHQGLREVLEHQSDDRSADTQRIVGAAFDAGLSLAEARWLVDQRADLRERLDERKDDDVLRIFLKLVDKKQLSKLGSSSPSKVGDLESSQVFETKVADGIEKELVRREVKRRLNGDDGASTKLEHGLLKDILAAPTVEDFRIDQIMPANGAMLIVAQRKVGKSTFTLDLSRSLLTGEPFLGDFRVVEPTKGRVAVMNYEVSGQQFARWAQDAGIPQDRLYLVNLRGSRNPLGSSEGRTELAEILRGQDVETLIVDPFGRAFTGLDQNSPGEVGRWLADLDRFTRSEVGAQDLILTAHKGWGKDDRARGASSLEDWGDSIVYLTRGEGVEEESRYLRAIGRDVHIEEDRLVYDQARRSYSMSHVGGRKCVAKNMVVDAVAKKPGITVSELEARLRSSGIPFQNNDARTAAKLAGQRRLVVRIEHGPGKKTEHFPLDHPVHGHAKR